MIRYVGLDVHKDTVVACGMDESGNVLFRQTVACTPEALGRFARQRLSKEDQVALETTRNTWAVVAILRPHVGKVVVGNPLKTKAIAEAKIKTDKIDAETLAQLLRCGYLPEVWQPDEATQRMRSLTTRRIGLMHEESRVKHRLQSFLGQRLIRCPHKRLFSQQGLVWLREHPWSPEERAILDSELRLLKAMGEETAPLEKQLAREAYQERRAKLLMTLPRVGFAVAQTLVAAWGDISRFPDGDHAASYLGLVPRTKQSSDHCWHGPITKSGNSHARWILIQAAQHLARQPGPLGVFFRRLAKKKGYNVAVTATARKLVVIGYLMLKHNEPYRYTVPVLYQRKMRDLRSRAGIRGLGPLKVDLLAPSPKSRPGERWETVGSLPQLYEREGLPPAKGPGQLPEAEVRVLKQRRVFRLLECSQQPQRHLQCTLKEAKTQMTYPQR
jgi:transposase